MLAAAPEDAAGQFRFELRGLLPPWVLHRLLHTLRKHHDSPVQV